MPTTISRDVFARMDVVRETVTKPDRKPCAWCGQLARFRYGVQPDSISGRVSWYDKMFCSVGCLRSYHL